MKLLGNFIWVLFGGLLLAIEYAILGLFWCITIIGIPFGIQLFKCASLSLWPFGREVRNKQQSAGCLSTGMNLIWILLGGFLMALEHGIIGLGFCITIIGIPFGIQHFKLAAIALTPFGREIVSSKKAKSVYNTQTNLVNNQNPAETQERNIGANIGTANTSLANDEEIPNETENSISATTPNLSNLLGDTSGDKQKIYIAGGALLAIVIGVALWFGLRKGSDDINIQLSQIQPVFWNKFVSPKTDDVPIYEQPDVSNVLIKIDGNSIMPVVDETSNFYKIYIGDGREAWIKKKQCKDIVFDPIKQDMLVDIFLNGQRLNSIINFKKGELENLALCYYEDMSYTGHMEVGVLDNGRLIRPMNSSFLAVATDNKGFTVINDGNTPRIEFGKDYKIDDNGFLDLTKLNNSQVAEIWKAALGNNPNKVFVSYYFPSRNTIRTYDVDLNVYGVNTNNSSNQAIEGTACLSGFKYVVESKYNSDLERSICELYAVTYTGEKVNVEITSDAYLLNILEQGDYDGDGENEAIVYEDGGGSMALPAYLVYYDKDAEVFKKVEGFEDIYDNAEIRIEEWNNKISLLTTVGLRHDRYIYENHSLTIVERIAPELGERIANISLSQLFSVDEDSQDRTIYVDIDGDGETDKLTFHHDTSHALNWGHSMELVKIETSNWSSPDGESLYVTGNTFTFLASKSNGIPNILCDNAWLYKWDGNKYVSQQ